MRYISARKGTVNLTIFCKKMTDKLAIVTGANGFVGSHLVDALLVKGYKVRCIVRKSSNLQWLNDKNVDYFYGGLNDMEALKAALTGCTHLFHVAGVVKSPTYDGFFEGNVTPTKNILEAALTINALKRIIVTSSLAAHGPNAVGKPSIETDSRKPVSEYGESKLAQEDLAANYYNRLPITVVRPPAVYGERDMEMLLLFQTVGKGIFPLIAKGQTLSMVHVSDLVEGMILAAESENSIGKTYFLSSNPIEFTQKHVAQTMANVLGKKLFFLQLPYLITYLAAAISSFFGKITASNPSLNLKKLQELKQPSWACSSAQASADFGYNPVMTLENGIVKTIDWYKQQGLL